MTQRFRTASGGRIDRTKPLRFQFDGRRLVGFAGDTLASALLANGIHLVGRSYKYHRPRGILSAGTEEPNALVTIRRDAARCTPNLPATRVELYEGLTAHSQNRWPSLRLDVGSVNDLVSRFMPVGFYYKTFMWPRHAWKWLYEPVIRAATGLGRAPTEPDPDRYAQRYAHCDVLVVGAGPAGLAAALTAGAGGERVLLCDEQECIGGSLLHDTSASIDEQPSAQWLSECARRLAAMPNVRLLTRTTAFGYFPHNMVGLNERLTDHHAEPPAHLPRERLWQVRARDVVLAAGALERPLVFPGNDRPGILLAGAAQAYLNRFGVLPGSQIVVVTGHDGAYRAALDLHAAGAHISVIADVRASAEGALPEAARQAGIRVRPATTVLGTRGRLRISHVELGAVDAAGHVGDGFEVLPCDALLMSGGLTPSVHLFSQARGQLLWSEGLEAFVPGRPGERCHVAGAGRGVFALGAAFSDGVAAGAAAVGTDGLPRAAFAVSADPLPAAGGGLIGELPRPVQASRAKSFVDWQNDVTAHDLILATREGFRSIEHIKRYTTTGMATDQGKTSNLNALGIAARALGRTPPQVGLTSFRMPYHPVSFGSLAGTARGDLFDPIRTTPMHDWAEARGAVFEDVGLWKRARYFPERGEAMHAAVGRECVAVRSRCGIFDASTLGKIEVAGPGALAFLNRLYVNRWDQLAVGRSRYGILLRDDGFIFDDGVIARIGADRFHVTTTTGGAPRVLALMEDYLQTEWQDLQVWLTSTTEQWAVITLQGPCARQVLEPLVQGIDLSAAALPHMSVAHGTIRGAPLRLFRVSFTGELGYELNVPADFGAEVWRAVFAAGEPYGITPYGTEAMHVLRAEKGYIIVGQDTDGTVTPDDVGLAWTIGARKEDFLGKRSLLRPALCAPARKQLVGLLTHAPDQVLQEGSQLIDQPAQRPPMDPIGHVTSAYHSTTLGRSIALGLVRAGRTRVGQTLYVPARNGDIPVTVTAPVFYDPPGARLHG